ncbi:hypothetical protein [Amycolatopsis sp. NPDC049159]|uniref:hypothetical protein n=1 Tax=Amycolatopsis sp. NPDC049159 TaxID=3157210 RepID=UPI003401A891
MSGDFASALVHFTDDVLFGEVRKAPARDGILSPSMDDPARNRHRTGVASAKDAVGVILTNPRYTGRQVWN